MDTARWVDCLINIAIYNLLLAAFFVWRMDFGRKKSREKEKRYYYFCLVDYCEKISRKGNTKGILHVFNKIFIYT